MKLKEILKETDSKLTQADLAWVSSHCHAVELYAIIDDAFSAGNNLAARFEQDLVTFSVPWKLLIKFKATEEINVPKGVASIIQNLGIDARSILYIGGKLTDPSQIAAPDHCVFLRLEHMEIDSLKFPSSLRVKKLVIGSSELNCGLLSLLKTNIEHVRINGTSFELAQASKIVDKHLSGDCDIAECSEELIDAGLEEYAKL